MYCLYQFISLILYRVFSLLRYVLFCPLLSMVMAYFQNWRTIKLAINCVSPLNFCSFFPFLTWWENGQLLFYGEQWNCFLISINVPMYYCAGAPAYIGTLRPVLTSFGRYFSLHSNWGKKNIACKFLYFFWQSFALTGIFLNLWNLQTAA